jgi:hypothetical protein
MSRQSPNLSPSKRKSIIDIEEAYLELQRLRDLVRQAECRQEIQQLRAGPLSNDHSAKGGTNLNGGRRPRGVHPGTKSGSEDAAFLTHAHKGSPGCSKSRGAGKINRVVAKSPPISAHRDAKRSELMMASGIEQSRQHSQNTCSEEHCTPSDIAMPGISLSDSLPRRRRTKRGNSAVPPEMKRPPT